MNYSGECDEIILWQMAYHDNVPISLMEKLATSSSDSTIKIHNVSYEYAQSKLSSVKGEIVKTLVNKDKSTGTVRKQLIDVGNPTSLAWLSDTSIVNGFNNCDILGTWDLAQEKFMESYRYTTDLNSGTVRTQANKLTPNPILGLLLSAH